MKLTWQLVGTKSVQLSGWGRPPACLKEGQTLFLSSSANWMEKDDAGNPDTHTHTVE